MNNRRLPMNRHMSQCPLVFYLLLVFVAFTGCFPDGTAQDRSYFMANGRKIDIADFNEAVNALLEDSGVPGMSLAIIENDEVVFSKGYGLKQLPPNYPTIVEDINKWWKVEYLSSDNQVNDETVFVGASLSKTYLAFVAMQLVDEGILDLDKPLYEYLEYERLAHDERYKVITGRMILSHSSGIENWGRYNDRNKLEIIRDPGTAFIYSGEGYHYLDYVIRKLINEPYDDYVQKRVIDGLGLTNTYLKYSKIEDTVALESGVPSNFSVGHRVNRGQFLGRNTIVHPASQNHFIAKDYAKLTISMFNTDDLSDARRKDLLDPRIQIDDNPVYYGPAFELFFSETDTIVAHGGDNSGYKNLMYYSPVQKRGFVMMTNADWGKSLGKRMNEMTVRLDLDYFFDLNYGLIPHTQYPSKVPSLLKTYYKSNTEAMFEQVEALLKSNELSDIDMNGLGAYFTYYGYNSVAIKVFEMTTKTFPDSPMAYTFLGGNHMGKGEYKQALKNFTKAKELNFSVWDIDVHIERCKKNLESAG